MTKPIDTSTYMQFNDTFREALDELYYTQNTDNLEYRALVSMALGDLIRNAAHSLPQDKAVELIDKLQTDMLRATATRVLGESKK